MRIMKRGSMLAIENLAWIAFVLVLALIILVFVIWRGKESMISLLEKLFDVLRFRT